MRAQADPRPLRSTEKRSVDDVVRARKRHLVELVGRRRGESLSGEGLGPMARAFLDLVAGPQMKKALQSETKAVPARLAQRMADDLADLVAKDRFIAAPPADAKDRATVLDGRTMKVVPNRGADTHRLGGAIDFGAHVLGDVFKAFDIRSDGLTGTIADVLKVGLQRRADLAHPRTWLSIVPQMAAAAMAAKGPWQARVGAAAVAGVSELAAMPRGSRAARRSGHGVEGRRRAPAGSPPGAGAGGVSAVVDNRGGVLLMLAAMTVFAVQDGVSKHLASHYSPVFVTMIRYWFFAAFVVALSARGRGGLRAAAATRVPALQLFRGALLAMEVVVMISAFAMIGLVESHAIFAGYPLLVTALSGPVLGERVGWRRWTAVGVGMVGVLIILRPGTALFAPGALIALLSMAMFAVYQVATRYANRLDGSRVSFFYTGLGGAVAITMVGPFFWTPMASVVDWAWMGALCVSGMLGHYLLIRALDAAEAAALQPFAYFQLVFAAALGVAVFGETLETAVALGAALVVAAGLFAAWRERAAAR